jgi:hypothetical protein
MKIFLSWSGETSRKVALVLREWLPSVIQSLDPYVSSIDIDKGARWSSDIAGELDASSYGIICLTPDNLSAPWINFEAGALGKSVNNSRVSPLLFRVTRTEVTGPLVQFQSTTIERDEIWKLLLSINNALGEEGLEAERLQRSFQAWWPSLEQQLSDIPDLQQAKAGEVPKSEMTVMLEELLDLARNNTRILTSSSSPSQDATAEIFRLREVITIREDMIEVLMKQVHDLRRFTEDNHDELKANPISNELMRFINRIASATTFSDTFRGYWAKKSSHSFTTGATGIPAPDVPIPSISTRPGPPPAPKKN